MDVLRTEWPISLRQSSWDLIDEAAKLAACTPSEILDSVMQGYLATDEGQALSRLDLLAKLRKSFGDSRG